MRAGGTLNLIFTNEGNGCNKLYPVQRPGRYYMLLMRKTTSAIDRLAEKEKHVGRKRLPV